jgi:uncharacterized protein (TIGR03435 family)
LIELKTDTDGDSTLMTLPSNSTRRTILSKACILAALPTLVGSNAFAQTATPDSATYAVASVRPSGADTGRDIKFLPGGTFIARGVNLRLLIKIAYNLNDDQIVGGPSWTGMKHFDIEAKPDPAADPAGRTESELNHLRLQALLRERFQLKLRSETKEMSTFALVVAKGGPKLKATESTAASPHFQGQPGRMSAENATMDNLAAALPDWVGHPVANQTGVQGRYDLKLEWTPDQAPSPQSNQPAPVYDAGPTIFTALKQQLGLTLESRKSSAQCQVMESVQLPTEN